MRVLHRDQSDPGWIRTQTRRQFLGRWANGIGAIGLLNMLQDARGDAKWSSGVPSRAKSLIFLYMDGGPSHMDTFDPKPRLAKENGRPLPMNVIGRYSSKRLLMSPYSFRRYGESGIDVSEIFPNVAKCVDEMTVVRSMVADHLEHPTSNMLMLTGSSLRGRPNIGSWLIYGLGTENRDLPGYVVLMSRNTGLPQGGMELFSSGFLPANYSYLPVVSGAPEPVPDARPLEEADRQQAKRELLGRLRRQSAPLFGAGGELDAIAANYELAFRMQNSVPTLMDLSGESKATLNLYGVDDPATETFGRECLLARRMVEKGVRVITLLPPTYPGANRWDQHNELANEHRGNAALVDKPIAGLLQDLRSRGLLDSTLVVWGGEFGRSPDSEVAVDKSPGREHNPKGFTMWLAGGGVRRGMVYGATDEYGLEAVENPVHVHDLHATILHLFGIDHTKLTYRTGGRDFRLTDVYGKVVHDILA